MQTFAVHDVERKSIAILEALDEVTEPLGSTAIARRLKESGIDLSDRTVRYHLKLLDERGLTTPLGRDGRLITPRGREELRNALVGEKIGLVVAKIEQLAYQTTFDWRTCSGTLPVNVSFFPRDKFRRCLQLMKPVFAAGLCVSDRVRVAEEGQRLVGVVVPPEKVGLATACSIVINGCLLKAGIPMDSKFGGILQVRDGKPLRFVDLIHYSGSSLDPSEAFIRARMTDVRGVVRDGNGKLLANFREIPSPARPIARKVMDGLRECGFNGAMVMGEANELVCEVPVGPNRVGMILPGGLMPVAAVHEAGIVVESRAMSGMIDYREMERFEEVYERYAAVDS
jgi:repressor of nif and glnA expression